MEILVVIVVLLCTPLTVFTLQLQPGHTSSSRRINQRGDRNRQFYYIRSRATAVKAYNGGNDDEDENPELVSDAEALLACWNYLQKRKRLGKWSGEEERKSQASTRKGFFLWDDLYDDLVQSDNNSSKVSVDPTIDSPLRGTIDAELRDVIPAIKPKISIFENTERSERGAEFTTYPSGPPERFVVRSKTAKKFWEEPGFREYWYERRWGHKKRKELEDTSRRRVIRQQKAEKRARALPAEFLGSEELASMTEEEIALAIREMVSSNQKRVVNIKKTKQEQRKAIIQSDPMLAGAEKSDDFFNNITSIDLGLNKTVDRPLIEMDETDLRERQRRRSEVAKRIYLKRLENDEDGVNTAKKKKDAEASIRLEQRPPRFPPKDMSPRSAKLRVEHSLDLGERPELEDVQLLLDSKTRGIRKLFQRIARESFGLRGKCIPNENGELGFLTHSTVENLGRFIIVKLQSSTEGEDGEDDM